MTHPPRTSAGRGTAGRQACRLLGLAACADDAGHIGSIGLLIAVSALASDAALARARKISADLQALAAQLPGPGWAAPVHHPAAPPPARTATCGRRSGPQKCIFRLAPRAQALPRGLCASGCGQKWPATISPSSQS